MKPIKITIKGSFLDCQIYRGWLYLWSFDGRLSIYDWNSIVDSLCEDPSDELAFKFSFKDGNYLYKQSLMELFCDTDFMALLIEKFQKIEPYKLTISENRIKDFLIGEMETPSGQPPIDTEIYNSNLYYCVDDGLYKANAHKIRGNPVSSKPIKLWDARILSLKANRYPQIALSAGSDGLFELSVAREDEFINLRNVDKQIHQVSERHSSFANYANLSIYSSSLVGSSYMALYNWREDNFGNAKREYSDMIDSSDIFGDNLDDLSWGVDGKVFRARGNGFNVVSFNNYEEHKRFNKQKDFKKNLTKGRIIGGASAFFGNIVEFENGLRVILTDNSVLDINQPVTKWRIYPRSLNYENQLHVLLEDEMRVYAFNHDYFISQIDKVLGIEYKDEGAIRRYHKR